MLIVFSNILHIIFNIYSMVFLHDYLILIYNKINYNFYQIFVYIIYLLVNHHSILLIILKIQYFLNYIILEYNLYILVMIVKNRGLNKGIIFFVMFKRVRDVIRRLRRCCCWGMMKIFKVIIVVRSFGIIF